jgi:protein TonB
MFEDSLFDSGGKKKATKKWMTFPLSLLMHAIIIITLIIVPLLKADSNLPDIKVIDVFMAVEKPKAPLPQGAAKKKTTRKRRAKKKEVDKKVEETRPISDGRLIAPIDIPEEIEEEEISDFGFEEDGVEGGVEGGIEGGVIGGVLGSPITGDSQAIRIASIQAPRLIKQVKPAYPPVALKARIKGKVILEAATDIYGRVIPKTIRIISGHPLLNRAVIEAIKQWIYEPYIINGVPRAVRFNVTLHFDLQGQ